MRILFIFLLALLQLAVAGCASGPKTAVEFRERVSAFFIPNMETFEVNRPFEAVVETFRKRVPKCLDSTVQRNMRYGIIFDHWNPTFTVTEDKAELYVQYFMEKKVMRAHNESEKGEFVFVADIIPAGAEKTGITMYMSSARGAGDISSAIKNWADGSNTGCPSLGIF